MVFVQTLLKIIDNTGGFYAKCIGILGNSKIARPGDEIVICIKSIILNKKITHRKKRKILKGTVRRAVLLRSAYPFRRWGNINLRCNSNAAAIVGT
jgi:large subunit ribosomal protein L14